MVEPAQYAALTGDLVRSSRLSARQSAHAMSMLKSSAQEFSRIHPGSIEGGLDTFRHDSWQLLLTRPALAVRAATFLRAALKMESDAKTKYDSRIAIGVGTVETISKRRISDSRGPAFTRSGKALDAMDEGCLALAAGSDSLPGWRWLAGGIVPLVDCVTGDWTPTEARAVLGALRGWTQVETAANWPDDGRGRKPTRQAVAKSLQRAHWKTMQRVLSWVEEAI